MGTSSDISIGMLKIESGLFQSEIAFHKTGSGPTLVFFHGWAHSGAVWRAVTDTLSENFTCIAVDLPGFGKSPPIPRNRIKSDLYADVIVAVVNSFAENNNVSGVVCDSMSGRFIAIAAMRSLKLPIDTICISGCPFDGLPPIIRSTRAHWFTGIGLRALQILPEAVSHWIIRRSNHLTVKKRGEFEKLISQMLRSSDPLTSKLLLLEMYDPFILKESLKDRYRFNFARGEFDQICKRDTLHVWSRELGANPVTVAGVGHTPMLENPEGYASYVAACFE